MQIQLDQLGDEPFRWQESLDLEEGVLGDGLAALKAVDCRGEIRSMTSGLLMRARLGYQQTLECGRCLGRWSEPIDMSVDLLINVRPEGAESTSESEEELDREDLGLLVLTEPVLDTEPMIVEQIRLGVPMKPLCRADCVGLCGRCGADLNQGPCSCEPEVDPRWGALAALRQ
ncbi:MAG: DUF177 domain-containing protein [Acidobacteriota bacterium]